jgi:hypothetical protein
LRQEEDDMKSKRLVTAAQRNVKKAARTVLRKIVRLPKRARTALSKPTAKVARRKR